MDLAAGLDLAVEWLASEPSTSDPPRETVGSGRSLVCPRPREAPVWLHRLDHDPRRVARERL